MWHSCCLIIFMLELKSQLNLQSPIHWLPSTVGMHQEEFDFATRTVTSSSLVVFLLWGSHWICSFSISFLYSLPSSSVFLPHIASSSFILWVARFWACLISWKGEKKKNELFKLLFTLCFNPSQCTTLPLLPWVLSSSGGCCMLLEVWTVLRMCCSCSLVRHTMLSFSAASLLAAGSLNPAFPAPRVLVFPTCPVFSPALRGPRVILCFCLSDFTFSRKTENQCLRGDSYRVILNLRQLTIPYFINSAQYGQSVVVKRKPSVKVKLLNYRCTCRSFDNDLQIVPEWKRSQIQAVQINFCTNVSMFSHSGRAQSRPAALSPQKNPRLRNIMGTTLATGVLGIFY